MPPSGSGWRNAPCSASAPPCEKPAIDDALRGDAGARSCRDELAEAADRLANARLVRAALRRQRLDVVPGAHAHAHVERHRPYRRVRENEADPGVVGSFSSGTIGTKSWPSAPRPCSQITLAEAGAAGASTTASADSCSRWVMAQQFWYFQ